MAGPNVSNPKFFRGNNAEAQNHSSHGGAVIEMERTLKNLCNELNHPADEVEIDCVAWTETLKKYIIEQEDRIYYSTVSNYVFQMGEEQFPDFLSNMGKVVDYAETNLRRSKDEDDRKTYRLAIKFYDHINLAHQQQVAFSSRKGDLKEEIKNQVKATLKPEIADVTKEMTSQLVGLVSIFTALSFIVFGGISSLDSIFNAVQGTLKEQNSVLPLLLVAIAWALCMMNLLFGFMYFVIRITHLPKPVDKDATNVVQRYPAVFLCNYILLALLVLFGGMWFAEQNGVGKNVFNFVVKDQSTWTFWISCGAFVAFFYWLGRKLLEWYQKKDVPAEAKAVQSNGSNDEAAKEKRQ